MKIARCVLLCALAVAVSVPSWAQAVRIDTVGSMDRKIVVAVPDFAASPELTAVATEMAAALANDLVFTGLFTTLPRQGYPPNFTGLTADATQLDFSAWKATKADYLVYAYVTVQGETIVAEFRMFDMVTSSQVVGQRLTARRDLPRLVAHRFSEEIVRCIDGVPGIASSQICFSASTANGKKEIFIADYDGYNAKQVTRHNSISIKPEFSPDGRKIAYLSYKDRYPFLYILDLSTGKSAPLSKNVGLNAAPAWAPDGTRLALVLSKDGNTEIYIKNADGTGERRITNNRAGDTSPTFSPDGAEIAFVSDRAGQPQIYAMDVTGGNVRRLSYQGGGSYDPVWSPDGKSIAYVVDRRGEGLEIYLMDADGGNARRITDTAGSNESPSWSHDSRHVICASSRTGLYGLWTINVEEPYEYHRISAGNMRCEGPYWGPRRK